MLKSVFKWPFGYIELPLYIPRMHGHSIILNTVHVLNSQS